MRSVESSWLEQGRVDTSRQVLDAVARTLLLDADAHRHALALAGFAPAPDGDEPPDHGGAPDKDEAPGGDEASYDPGLRAVLDGWPDSPALLLGPALDVLAWNLAPWWDCRSVGDFAPRTVALTPEGSGQARPYGMTLLLAPRPQDAAVLVLAPR
ncbi:hypothetical protein [Streptomyces sp. NPDC058308]|uniref:hypothetical protein n=1 Tax=Streptomyces sp. NPDC058308 TaxID=3346440 RepID=UPI0036E3630C